MAIDPDAIGLTLFAHWVSGRATYMRRTFGFQRAEVLPSLLNAMVLWIIAAVIFTKPPSNLMTRPTCAEALPLV